MPVWKRDFRGCQPRIPLVSDHFTSDPCANSKVLSCLLTAPDRGGWRGNLVSSEGLRDMTFKSRTSLLRRWTIQRHGRYACLKALVSSAASFRLQCTICSAISSCNRKSAMKHSFVNSNPTGKASLIPAAHLSTFSTRPCTS